jgi:hypothetical protein
MTGDAQVGSSDKYPYTRSWSGSYSRGGEGGGYRWPEHLATRR